jgi:hypothetical protein
MFTAAQSAVNTPRLIALIINLFSKLLVLEYKKRVQPGSRFLLQTITYALI